MNETSTHIEYTINSQLYGKIDPAGLSAALQKRVESLMYRLLLKVDFKVDILPFAAGQYFPRVRVDGIYCAYPLYLQQQVYHVTTDSHLSVLWEEDELQAHLNELVAENLGLYFTTLFEQIIYCQPQILATEHVVRLSFDRDQLALPNPALPFPQVKQLIAKLISYWVPIMSLKTLTTQLENSSGMEAPVENSFEELFSGWRSLHIELRMPESYLRYLTLHSFNRSRAGWERQSSDVELFELMKNGLFYENGIAYPPVKLILSEDLPADSFQVGIGNWRSLPIKGIKDGDIMSNTLSSVSNRTIFSIANTTSYAVLPEEQETVSGTGNRWSPLGYVILVMSQLLRSRADWFVDKHFTAGSLKKLAQLYPRLADAATKAENNYLVTMVLRQLAAEEISIRDLVNILQRIIEADLITADESSEIIFDNRVSIVSTDPVQMISNPVFVCSYVRHHLKNYITSKYTRNTNNLSVILADRKIEDLMMEDEVAPAEKEKILEALRDVEPFGVAPIPILTTSNLRPRLRALIATAFPFVSVMSYRELTEYSNITVSGKITL